MLVVDVLGDDLRTAPLGVQVLAISDSSAGQNRALVTTDRSIAAASPTPRYCSTTIAAMSPRFRSAKAPRNSFLSFPRSSQSRGIGHL